MTIPELYAEIGGNYDKALKVMRKEKLIDRYVRKLQNSHLDEMLAAAGDAMDASQLFESAHAMKGVCANLGLDHLADAADVITEEFRAGNDRKMSDEEVKKVLGEIDEMYKKVIAGIEKYESSN